MEVGVVDCMDLALACRYQPGKLLLMPKSARTRVGYSQSEHGKMESASKSTVRRREQV